MGKVVASQTVVETRTVKDMLVVVEYHQQMAFPAGDMQYINPAINVLAYQPNPKGASSKQTLGQLILRQVFMLPYEANQTKAGRQQFIDSKLQHVIDTLSGEAKQSDIMPAGVYSNNSAPTLYLLERACFRDGYVEVLSFDAHQGAHVRRTLVHSKSLRPVRQLFSQEWLHELHSHRPAHAPHATLDSLAGCLLGGAVGDALGAGLRQAKQGVPFATADQLDFLPIAGKRGTLSWHSQMTLFTAEGLIRAKRRSDEKGICDIVGVVLHAYYRWLATQGYPMPDPAPVPTEADGWLVALEALHARRGPSQTVLTALRGGKRGNPKEPINKSKGVGALARIAPVGLTGLFDTFSLGCEIAALTHGHATGYVTAGYFATLLDKIVRGASLTEALDAADDALKEVPNHKECLKAVAQARELANSAPATPATVATLGSGTMASEALAITVFCALKANDFAHGVWLATSHSGECDLTGALTGQLLGLLFGKQAIPQRWLDQLELRNEIAELAWDFFIEFANPPEASWFAADWEKYPGW